MGDVLEREEDVDDVIEREECTEDVEDERWETWEIQ